MAAAVAECRNLEGKLRLREAAGTAEGAARSWVGLLLPGSVPPKARRALSFAFKGGAAGHVASPLAL